MEKKDWKEDFHNRFVQHYAEDDIYNFYGYGDDAPQMGSGKEDVDDVIAFIEQEIDRARKEQFTEEELKLLSGWGSALWGESNAFTLIVGDVNFGDSGKNTDLINKIDKLTN